MKVLFINVYDDFHPKPWVYTTEDTYQTGLDYVTSVPPKPTPQLK